LNPISHIERWGFVVSELQFKLRVKRKIIQPKKRRGAKVMKKRLAITFFLIIFLWTAMAFSGEKYFR